MCDFCFYYTFIKNILTCVIDKIMHRTITKNSSTGSQIKKQHQTINEQWIADVAANNN